MNDPEMDWLRQNAAQQPPSDIEMEWLRRQAVKNQPKTTAEEGAAQAAADTPPWQAPLVAAGKWTNEMLSGIRAPLARAEATISRPFAPQYAAARDAEAQQLGAGVGQGKQDYAPLAQKYPISTFAGETVPSLMFKTPLGMAIGGALSYGSPGERATNALGGYVGGKIGEKVATGAARLFGPNQGLPVGQGAQQFFSYGTQSNPGNVPIPLTVGQSSQWKPAQITETVLKNLPFTAGTMASAGNRQFGAFNRNIAQSFGSDSTSLTPDIIGQALKREGGNLDTLAARNPIRIDNVGTNQLADTVANAQRDLGGAARPITNIYREIYDQVQPNGTIPGQYFRTLDSRLGRLAMNAGDGNVGGAFKDLQTTVRDIADRSLQQTGDAVPWATARHNLHNALTVSDATAAHPSGDLTPAGLLKAVNAHQPQARFGAGNDLADLSHWASQYLPDTIPNSGTAQRAWYQKALESPVTSAGSLVGVGYGLDQTGVGSGEAGAGVAVPYSLAKILAGKGMTPAELAILKRAGGLLGYGAASGNQ